MKSKLFTKHLISLLTIVISLFGSSIAFAQLFEFEQSSPKIKWRQINSPHYQLIYPIEAENNAQLVASLLDRSMESIALSLRTKPRKIPILLRNQSVESNGFVQLSPRRSEFFTTPPQHSDPINWLQSLAIHEYRHVVQIDKLTPKPPFELIGLAFFGITLPPWFYEGDAVAIETLLTPAGRGRLPSWEMPMRTNLLSGKKFSYQKNYLGSLKDITAGYYELGYFITTNIRREFGAEIMDSVLNRMSKIPFRPYNFSNSLKKFTGRNTKQWYEHTLADLQKKWENQLEENNPESYDILPPLDSSAVNNFFLPQSIDHGQIIALSSRPSKTNAIVLIDSLGKQNEVIKTGRQTHPNFSYSNGVIAWDEIRYDKRFHKSTYNVINSYDMIKKKYRQLSRKSRLFSPTLSADGKKIAAIEVSLNNEVSLVLLDAQNGEKALKIPAPEGMHLQTPSFHPDGEKVVAVGVSNTGASLIEFTLPSKNSSILLTELSQQLERPVYAGNKLLFKATYNGIDNLYSFDLDEHTVHQLTNSHYGAFNPSYDTLSQDVLFNNYQPNGYQISKINLQEIDPRPISETRNTFINYFEPLLSQEKQITLLDSSSIQTHESTPYKELNNLFNFHSISIGSDDFESVGDLKLGLLLLSDNLLNTMSIRIGAAYNQKIHRPEFTATLTYQRYFPKFNIHFENSGQLSGIKLDPRREEISQVRWRENEIKFNMQIPLFFNRLDQVFQTGFQVGSSYTYRYQLDRPEINDRFIKELRFPLEYGLYFNKNKRRSAYDLAPRWGQNITLYYKNLPFEKRLKGEAISLRSTFYFPGIMLNHSLRTRFSFQQHSGNFQYSNYIPMVSGYDHLKPSLPQNTLLVDYKFPISYPDWQIGSLAYIKRFKGGFFSDFEDIGSHRNFKPRTFGAEIRADMNLLRFYLPLFDIGAKAIYINEPNDKRWAFEFGFSYSH